MERLSAQDLITLWPDEVGWPQDMGALAILDGGRPAEAEGATELAEVVRATVGARLHLTPRLRQVIYAPPLGLGRPLWVDAPRFNLSQHVRVHHVPDPGDEAQLLTSVEGLRRRPLNPSAPLWEIWLLPGLSGGRIGLYLRVHHALADGPAAVALLAAFLDIAPDGTPVSAQPWAPAARPPDRDLFADNLRRCQAALNGMAAAAAHPRGLFTRARAAGSAVRAGMTSERAPRSSLNRRIGSDRRLSVVRSDLDLVRDAAHRQDATVNDVLLTAVAGGLRGLLRGRGERVEGLVLRAIVPIALPHRRQEHQQGNVLGQMIVPLPVGVADPVERLRLIAGPTAERRQGARPRRLPVLRSHALQHAAMRLAARQRLYNVYIANLHGPQTPLYLAGARLLEIFPVAPLLGNLTLGVGALSYAGQFTVMAVGDRVFCPDLDVFTAAVDTTLQALT